MKDNVSSGIWTVQDINRETSIYEAVSALQKYAESGSRNLPLEGLEIRVTTGNMALTGQGLRKMAVDDNGMRAKAWPNNPKGSILYTDVEKDCFFVAIYQCDKFNQLSEKMKVSEKLADGYRKLLELSVKDAARIQHEETTLAQGKHPLPTEGQRSKALTDACTKVEKIKGKFFSKYEEMAKFATDRRAALTTRGEELHQAAIKHFKEEYDIDIHQLEVGTEATLKLLAEKMKSQISILSVSRGYNREIREPEKFDPKQQQITILRCPYLPKVCINKRVSGDKAEPHYHGVKSLKGLTGVYFFELCPFCNAQLALQTNHICKVGEYDYCAACLRPTMSLERCARIPHLNLEYLCTPAEDDEIKICENEDCTKQIRDELCARLHKRKCEFNSQTGFKCRKCDYRVAYRGKYRILRKYIDLSDAKLYKKKGRKRQHDNCWEVYCTICADYMPSDPVSKYPQGHTCYVPPVRKIPDHPLRMATFDFEARVDPMTGQHEVVSAVLIYQKEETNPYKFEAVAFSKAASKEDRFHGKPIGVPFDVDTDALEGFPKHYLKPYDLLLKSRPVVLPVSLDTAEQEKAKLDKKRLKELQSAKQNKKKDTGGVHVPFINPEYLREDADKDLKGLEGDSDSDDSFFIPDRNPIQVDGDCGEVSDKEDTSDDNEEESDNDEGYIMQYGNDLTEEFEGNDLQERASAAFREVQRARRSRSPQPGPSSTGKRKRGGHDGKSGNGGNGGKSGKSSRRAILAKCFAKLSPDRDYDMIAFESRMAEVRNADEQPDDMDTDAEDTDVTRRKRKRPNCPFIDYEAGVADDGDDEYEYEQEEEEDMAIGSSASGSESDEEPQNANTDVVETENDEQHPQVAPPGMTDDQVKFPNDEGGEQYHELDPNHIACEWEGYCSCEKEEEVVKRKRHYINAHYDNGSVLEQFMNYILNDPRFTNMCLVAHYGRGYDVQFIAEYMLKHGIKHKSMYQGNKLLTSEIVGRRIYFRDFSCYCPSSLAKAAAGYGLSVDLEKTFFPYKLIQPQYYGLHLPHLPSFKDYEVDRMDPEKRKAFFKWYKEQQVKKPEFILREELLKYNYQDTLCLLACVLKFIENCFALQRRLYNAYHPDREPFYIRADGVKPASNTLLLDPEQVKDMHKPLPPESDDETQVGPAAPETMPDPSVPGPSGLTFPRRAGYDSSDESSLESDTDEEAEESRSTPAPDSKAVLLSRWTSTKRKVEELRKIALKVTHMPVGATKEKLLDRMKDSFNKGHLKYYRERARKQEQKKEEERLVAQKEAEQAIQGQREVPSTNRFTIDELIMKWKLEEAHPNQSVEKERVYRLLCGKITAIHPFAREIVTMPGWCNYLFRLYPIHRLPTRPHQVDKYDSLDPRDFGDYNRNDANPPGLPIVKNQQGFHTSSRGEREYMAWLWHKYPNIECILTKPTQPRLRVDVDGKPTYYSVDGYVETDEGGEKKKIVFEYYG